MMARGPVAVAMLSCAMMAMGHDLSTNNVQFVQSLQGPAPLVYLYLGAKHMFTGYDHLLFLVGVVFYLHNPRDVVLYVTLFTLGHSVTLLLGVWQSWQVSAHLVDTLIGLSIVYKAFENLGGFQQVFGFTPDSRLAVLLFGFCHGLGLATRLQDSVVRGDGLLVNLLSFNLGVEFGQVAALFLIVLALMSWRRSAAFQHQAFAVNSLLMCAGFILAGSQFVGYLLT